MSRTAFTRHPAGTAQGGRFAPEERAESLLQLDVLGSLDQDDDPARENERGAADFGGVVDGVLSDDGLAAFTSQQGRKIAARAGGDPDDHAQELALRMLEARNRFQQKAAQNGEAWKRTAARDMDERRYGRQIAMHLINLRRSGMTSRYEDRQGMLILGRRECQFEREHGRRMTAVERERMADAIRMQFPAKGRPTRGFHLRKREVLVDLQPTDTGDDYAYSLTAQMERALRASRHQGAPADGQPDGVVQEALARIEDGDRRGARRQLWATLGGPDPRESSIRESDAAQVRRHIHGSGGAARTAARYLAGRATADDTHALFAPFGPVDDAEKESIARVLVQRTGFADLIHDNAVAIATVPRKPKGG